MLNLFRQARQSRAAQYPAQSNKHVRKTALASFTRAAIAAVGQNYVVDNTGRYIAVFRLLGSDFGVVDEYTLGSHLKVLQGYLERTADPIQRISASYLQPLNPYLAYLKECTEAAQQYIPHLVAPLTELHDYMTVARDRFQARLGADYWVVTYQPKGNNPLRIPGVGLPGGARQNGETDLGQQDQGLLARLQRFQKAAQARAVRELDEHCALFFMALKRAEIKAQRLEGSELAALFEASWQGNLFDPAALRQSLTQPLTPEDMTAMIRTPIGFMELTSTWARTSSGYVRSWYVRDFAGLLSPDMMNWLSQEPGVRVVQFCEQMPMVEARRVLRLNRTIASSERYMRPQGDIPDYDWLAKAQSNDEVRQALSFRGEPVFRYRAIIQQWAESEEELEERSRGLLLSLRDRAQLVVHQATFRQDDALFSCLPLGRCRIEKPERNMDAKSLARLLYPSARDPLQPQGVWLGMALPSKLMVTMDLFALQNPVVELVGIMGSGKSVTQKFLLTQLIAQGYPGFVLDGAREYISTVEALNGTIIRLGSVHGPGFNPVHFDPLDESEEGDPFVVGQALFLDWVEAALHPLSDIEKSVVGEAYLRALENAGIIREDRDTWEKPRPLLSHIYEALMEEPGDPDMGHENPQIVARRIALALKPFALGVYAPLFNRPDQLSLGNEQLVCFDVYDVPDRLRLPFIHQLLAFVQRQTLRRYRYRGSVIVLDEGHLLLHDERSARILEHLVRNGRKAGQLMLFTQHTHTDSQRNRSAQLAHKTAGATLVFRINRQDVDTLNDLHLSPLEKRIVVEQNEGECLLVAPEGHIRLKVLIPPAWYPRFTTKPGEVLGQLKAKAEQEPAQLPPAPAPSGLAGQPTPAAIPAPSISPAIPASPMPAAIPAAPIPPGRPAMPMPTASVVPPAPTTQSAPEPAAPASLPGEASGLHRRIPGSTRPDPATTSWENTLVGASQIAPEWLQAETPVNRSPADVSFEGALEQSQGGTLRLVWSKDFSDEGGGA